MKNINKHHRKGNYQESGRELSDLTLRTQSVDQWVHPETQTPLPLELMCRIFKHLPGLEEGQQSLISLLYVNHYVRMAALHHLAFDRQYFHPSFTKAGLFSLRNRHVTANLLIENLTRHIDSREKRLSILSFCHDIERYNKIMAAIPLRTFMYGLKEKPEELADWVIKLTQNPEFRRFCECRPNLLREEFEWLGFKSVFQVYSLLKQAEASYCSNDIPYISWV